MKIGISGASRHLGRAVIRELQARGQAHNIVAISRTPGNERGGAEGRLGDYDKPEILAPPYANLDRLLLIPSADLQPRVRGRQISAAIDAAVRAGVGHIYLVSAAGTRAVSSPPSGLAPSRLSSWAGTRTVSRSRRRWAPPI